MSSSLINLQSYFERIGYSGPKKPTLSVLNNILNAHVQSIPFENLDVLLARPITLDAQSLQKKLIENRRGGYCFEQNGFLNHALEALNFNVTAISARVRIGYQRSQLPPRTHLFLKVAIDGNYWLADVGVGGLTPTSAIKLVLDKKQVNSHEPRRIMQDEGIYYHQVQIDKQWQDVCEFTLEEMPLIDCEVANWYTSVHPNSLFRNSLLVARAAENGVRLSLQNNIFSIRDANGLANKHTITSKQELLATLKKHFGLELPAESQSQLRLFLSD